MAAKRAPLTAASAPAEYVDDTVYAFMALARGEANEFQQKRVLDWIIQDAARTYDVSYRPDSERETVFAEGRRFVGLQVVKMVNYPRHLLKKVKDEA
jgi:hypothetical protein